METKMKPGKIFWGVFFLGLGALLLLQNFADLDFSMPELKKFWPVLLIAAGVVYLTKNQIIRNVIAGLSGFALAFIILSITASIYDIPKSLFSHVKVKRAHHDLVSIKSEPYDTTIKLVKLSFDGGAGSYIVSATDTNLMTLKTDRSNRKFSITNNISNGKADLDVEMAEFNLDLSDTSFANLVELNLNPKPFYENLEFNIGASNFELNIGELAFRKLDLEMGASSTKIVLPMPPPGGSEIKLESGASSIEIIIPQNAQLKMINSMALSDTKLPQGFKEEGNTIFSDNFTGTGDFFLIRVDGGVNSMVVRRK
mgnify:CR=1 FL=1